MSATPSSENVNGSGPAEKYLKRGSNVIFFSGSETRMDVDGTYGINKDYVPWSM